MDAPTNRQLLDPTRWPAQPAPLAWVAVGLCLGIAIDRLQALPAALWLASFVACGVGLAVALRARARWASLAIVAAAASVGAVLHQVHYRRVEARHIVRYCASQPILARLQGTVLGPVRVSQPRPTFGRWMPRPAQTRFRLAVRRIEALTRPLPATGLVQVRISEPLLVLHPGQEVEAFGRLYRLPAPDNPGEFDWRRLQRRRAVLAGLSCNSARSVRVIRGQPASLWRRLRAALRCRASEYLLGGVQPDDTPTCSLLEAMLLGQRSAVQRSINDAFVRTGAAHFLSVSGIHVGFVAIFGWMLARLVGLTRRGSAGLVALLVILYVVVAEPRPPILRAGVMALLACAAISLGRPFNSANWIGAAAIVILAARPAELFLAGFQLSFGVVLAVIYLSPRVRQVLFGTSPEIERLRPRPVQLSAARQATSWLCQKLDWALAVAVAAWLVGAPLTAYHFGRWSPLGALNSLLIAPLVFVLMIAGFVKMLVAAVIPAAGAVLAPLVTAPAVLLKLWVGLLASLPLSSIECRSPPLWLLAGWYLLLTGWSLRWRLALWPRAGRLAAGLLSVGFVWWLVPPDRSSETLKVHVLSVGAGSATIIELPNGKTILYDAGTKGFYDVGSAAVVPALHRFGVRRIDAAIISHPNLDHFSGLLSVVDRMGVELVLISRHFEPLSPAGSPSRWLLQQLAARSVPVRQLGAGDRLTGTGQVAAQVLWPPPPESGYELSANDSSIVLKLQYAGHSILLPGDVEQLGQELLLGRADLACDVLVLPHHGAVRPNTARFIEATRADWLICSDGPASLGRTELTNVVPSAAELYHTAELGCITVVLTRLGVTVRPFLQVRAARPGRARSSGS